MTDRRQPTAPPPGRRVDDQGYVRRRGSARPRHPERVVVTVVDAGGEDGADPHPSTGGPA